MNLQLRANVERDLQKEYSPEQIAGRLRRECPDREELGVSPETIYQALFLQSRGGVKHELTKYFRTGDSYAFRRGKLGSASTASRI